LISVVYRQIILDQSNDVVLNFKLLPGAVEPKAPAVIHQSAADVVSALQLPQSSTAFVSTLNDYPESLQDSSESVSLLLIDSFAAQEGGEALPTDQIEGLPGAIETALKNVYKRENHVARLGDNRYGFLLRHSTEPQAYLLTRKIMQICNAIETGNKALTISSTGCLFGVSRNKEKSTAQLLRLATQGLDVVNQRGKNQALLLDLRRMLPVYANG